MLNAGLSNHYKTTKQQEKALAIDSGVDRCASAWRQVEKVLKTLPHKPSFWIRVCVHFFSIVAKAKFTSSTTTTITFSN